MTDYAAPFVDDDIPYSAEVAKAKLNGHAAPGSFVSKLGAVWFHDIAARKAVRNWLLKNLILWGQFGIIYGAPGSGKSSLAMDLSLSMASVAARDDDKPLWFGYRGKCFGVIYVIREDKDDFEVRLQAWRIERGVPAEMVLPFVYLPTSLDLRSNDVDMRRLAEEISGLSHQMEQRCGTSAGMLVIDTVSHVLGGGNESGSDVMGAFLINCTKLQEMTGVTLAAIHHAGKTEGRGPRGSEVLHGAAGFEIEVMPPDKDQPNKWTLRKQRAAKAGQTHFFKLRSVAVGIDDDGEDITACVVDMMTASRDQAGDKAAQDGPPIRNIAKDGRVILRAREEMALRSLVSAINQVGRRAPAHTRTTIADICVTLTDWRDEFSKLLAGENEDAEKLKERTKKARDAAALRFISWGIIDKDGDWVWRTGKKVMNIDRAEREHSLPPSNVRDLSGEEF